MLIFATFIHEKAPFSSNLFLIKRNNGNIGHKIGTDRSIVYVVLIGVISDTIVRHQIVQTRRICALYYVTLHDTSPDCLFQTVSLFLNVE